VDLAYRLSWAGFPCLVVDSVKVYHDRQVGEKGHDTLGKLKAHHEKAEWAKANSLKGQLITVKKNFDRRFSLSVKLRTSLNGLIRFLHTLFLDPGMLRVYKDVRAMKKEIERKRKAIHKKASPSAIEALMS